MKRVEVQLLMDMILSVTDCEREIIYNYQSLASVITFVIKVVFLFNHNSIWDSSFYHAIQTI